MAFTPLLKLTDGTTSVHLVGAASMFRLSEWLPARAGSRTTHRTASLLDGRIPVTHNYENVVEQMKFQVQHANQDLLIEVVQDLDMLLTKARDYWLSSWQMEPVWLEARGPGETNTRYAVITDYQLSGDGNPYASPFFLCEEGAGFNDFGMVLEHRLWQDQEPGDQECVAGDTLETYPLICAPLTELVVAQTDDCYVDVLATSIDTAGVNIKVGKTVATANLYHCGVRFQTVNIPAGVVISSAYLRFMADTSLSGTDCDVQIYAEQASMTRAAFSTYANFTGRTRYATNVAWTIPAMTAGNSYDSADISALIQHYVDDPNWVANTAMVFQIFGNYADAGAYRDLSSFDHAADDEPELHIYYYVADGIELGQEESCSHMFFANKHVNSNITHMFHYTNVSGAWSANLLTEALGTDILPAVPAANDCLYIGCCSDAGLDHAPFNNLIFDLVGGNYSAWEWKYNDAALPGAANWVAFPDEVDETAGLRASGTNQVFFEQPTDWELTTINGVTGWWVRFMVTNAGGAPDAPKMDDRYAYTAVRNIINIDDAQIPGTLPALARHLIYNYSGSIDNPPEELQWDTMSWWLGGLRSRSRGANFRSFINATADHQPDDITVSLGTDTQEVGNNTTFPTGRYVYYDSAGVEALEMRVRWTFEDTLAAEYAGVYRAYVRGCIADFGTGQTAGDIRAQLVITNGNDHEPFWYGDIYDVPLGRTNHGDSLVSLGTLNLWPILFEAGQSPGDICIELWAECVVAAVRLFIVSDLILIPADEWTGQVWLGQATFGGVGALDHEGGALIIDSINIPKQPFRGYSTGYSGSLLTSVFPGQVLMPREAIWQARTDQMMHYLVGLDVGGLHFAPTNMSRALLQRVSRYHIMRGSK